MIASELPTLDPAPIRRSSSERSGVGRLRCSLVNGVTIVREARADSPLKLLCLQRAAGSAWIFASTYGGGLLAGDRIALAATFDPGARSFLGTQAATKIYRSPAGQIARQSLHASLAEQSLCVVLPDPITCFARARFEQRQIYDLDASASLVLVDWLTSGRHASGERWAFDRYDSRIDLHIAGKLRLRETLLLDPDDGPIAARSRMGRYDCFATMILVGPMVRPMADEILRVAAGAPAMPGPLLVAASALADGAICRIAGSSPQAVARWMHHRLSGVGRLLGESPWERKR